jgi:hypothetical protein
MTIVVDGINSASSVWIVAPSDSVDLAYTTRAIRVTVGGAVKINTLAGDTVVCAFLDGETRAIRATRIWATGTTATGLEGMY